MKFVPRLLRGVIIDRPNRFVMHVSIGSVVHRCHCPVTVSIGALDFKRGGIPCLLSPNTNSKAKTAFTVQAISLDPPNALRPSWIGINQNAANRYVEELLKGGQLNEILGFECNDELVKREVPLGRSRIDFLVNDMVYVEVKTVLGSIPSEKHPNFDKSKSIVSHCLL